MPGIARFGQKDYQLRMLTSEALAAGDFVNIYSNAGTPNARKADAALGYPAHAFVNGAYGANVVAIVELVGVNVSQSGLTPGTVYLSASVPGRATSTAPATGLLQQVGIAIAPTVVIFSPATTVAVGVGGISTAVSSVSAFFGKGFDGAAVLDGTNTVAWATKSGSVYTQTAAANCTNLTINSGVTIKAERWPVICSGTYTNNGIHQDIGNNGGPGSGGAGLVASSWFGSSGSGGAPGNTGAAGTVGAVANSITPIKGGDGGSSPSGVGGAGVFATVPAASAGGLVYATSIFGLFTGRIGFASTTQFNFGTGGAGGRGDAGGFGGGGGAAAGIVGIYARYMAGNGIIRVRGGDGGAPQAGTTNAGGGGSGPGGVIAVITTTAGWQSLFTLDLAGGTPGAGKGTGTAGTTGQTGIIVDYIV